MRTGLSICFIDILGLIYTGDSVYKRGLGGSESAVIYLGEELTKLGFNVTVYNHCEKEGIYSGVEYIDLGKIREENRKFDIIISSRSVLPLAPQQFGIEIWSKYGVDIGPFTNIISNATYKALWMHDTFVQGEEYVEPFLLDGFFHELFLLSDWHSHYVSQSDHWDTPKRRYEQLKHYIFQTRNGIKRYVEEVDLNAKDKNLFVYNSSITKGMVPLVEDLWPEVRKNIPEAKLMVIGGFYSNAGKNGGPDESEINFYKLMEAHNGKNGITFTGVIPQKQIAEILCKASFMLYPPAFPETYGISTLEAINYNTLPITSRYGALEEVAMKSVSYLTEYEYFKDDRQKQRMIDNIMRAYKDDYLREQKQHACDEIKKWTTWDKVADQWRHHFYNVFRIIPSREETERVRKITSNVNRIFRRRNINQEDLYEAFNCTSEKEIVVISPAYNAEKYIGNCIYSVAAQIYDNYKHIIIDDISTDNTVERAKNIISILPKKIQSKFQIIKNTEKGNALSNQVKEIEKVQNEDAIIVLLDGDDWLSNNPDIFRFLNDLYESDIKMSYGSCRSLADNISLIAQNYPNYIKEEKRYREYQFRWGIPYTHLRTFKKELYNRIEKDLLLDSTGNFYGPGGDGALLYCLLEAAEPKEIEAVKRVLVEYNDLNPLNDYKTNSDEQDKNQAEILKRKPSPRVEEPKTEAMVLPANKKIDGIFNLYQDVMSRDEKAINSFKEILAERDDAWIDNLDDPRIQIRINWLKDKLEQLNISKDAKILDIGSWSGGFANYFYELGYQNITCLDISKENISLGKRTFPALKWIHADIEKAVLTEKYDIIFMFEILEHLVDSQKTLKQVNNYLNDNGFIFVTIPTEDTVFVGAEHISAMTEANFRELTEDITILKGDEFNWYAVTIEKRIPKRILIGIPTAKYIETDCFASIYNLIKPEGVQVDFQAFYGYNIAQIRNLMANYTILGNYDYIFWVDSDIVLPRDSLIKLLSHNKSIVCGTYIQRWEDKKIPEIYLDSGRGGVINASMQDIEERGLIEIKGCGFGCVLTSKRCLEKIGYPQFEYHNALDHNNTISEDVDFCTKAINKGYKIYADTSIMCEHIGSTRFKIK